MSEYTERENAFIDGLVDVLTASNEAFRAETAVEQAMLANVQQLDSLREEQSVEIEDVQRYAEEAIARSPFDEHDQIVQHTRASMEAATQALDSLRGNDDLPVL